jgi:hypothetical protein
MQKVVLAVSLVTAVLGLALTPSALGSNASRQVIFTEMGA